jgi:cleavage and polyadenylation specificity factor subunit 1
LFLLFITSRLAVRKDSIALIVITLDLLNHSGTIIWSRWELPYDCERMLPVPRPIGGVLIFSSNILLHIDQIHSYGLSMNDYALKSSNFQLDRHETLKIHLDESAAMLIAHDQCLMILESGAVYLAKLLTDGRTVIRITMTQVDKVEAKISCTAHLRPSWIFLGSCLGDSMVYSIGNVPIYSSSDTVMASDSIGSVKSGYLRECDRLECFAPITEFSIGFSQEISKELTNGTSYELELVAGVGHGKTGAVGVFHRQLRPDILYSYDVGSAKALFSLEIRSSRELLKAASVTTMTAAIATTTHLLLSFDDRTLVLETKRELTEMDHETCPFMLDRTTVLAETLPDGNVLQVCDDRALLIGPDLKLINTIEFDFPSYIVEGLILDHLLLLRDQAGKIHLFSYEKPNRFIPRHQGDLMVGLSFNDPSDLVSS